MKQSAKNKTILVVEDEEDMLRVLIKRFSEEGFNVLKAKNGKEGLERALKKSPDLILLDLILPEINGVAMLKELRKDSWGKNIPVIILTNLTNMGITAEVLSSGVYDFLVKTDWKLEDVVRKVKERLGLK